jgi:hypothetical protein
LGPRGIEVRYTAFTWPAEIAGCGSFVESYPLVGLHPEDYNSFFLRNLVCFSRSARTHSPHS